VPLQPPHNANRHDDACRSTRSDSLRHTIIQGRTPAVEPNRAHRPSKIVLNCPGY
jgi:hypothetical protein